MLITKSTLIRAREISSNLSQGINPLNNKPIENADFLNDPKMIRYFSFISEVLTGNIEIDKEKKVLFYILPEEINEIRLPSDDITISVFTAAVNNSLHLGNRKPLSASRVNNQLKKMGILKTEIDRSGKKRSRVTKDAAQHGIVEEEIERSESNYYRISYTEKGKQFLLNHLIEILNYSDE